MQCSFVPRVGEIKKSVSLVPDVLRVEKKAAKKGLIPSFNITRVLRIFYRLRDKVRKKVAKKKCPVAILEVIHKVIRRQFEISGKDPSILMSEGLLSKKLDCDLVCGIYLSIAREFRFFIRGAFLTSHTVIVLGRSEPFLYFDTLGGGITESFHWKSSRKRVFPEPLSDTEFMSTYYNTLGVRCAEDGKYKDAVSFFEEALKCYSLDARLYYHKGVSLAHLGRFDEAVNWCNRAISLNSFDWKARFNMGVCLAMAERYKEAVKFYDRAVKLCPGNHTIYYHRADALLRLGQLQLAIKNYKQALNICPTDKGLRKDYNTALRYAWKP